MARSLTPSSYNYSPDAAPEPQEACVVFADMIGSTKFWSDVLKPGESIQQTSEIAAAWTLVSSRQSAIMKAMLEKQYKGTFVKGVGDELIFNFRSVDNALKAAKNAYKKLAELGENNRITDPNKTCPSFRFVIHWTREKVIAGWYDLSSRKLGLKAVFEDRHARNSLVHPPQSPDLFGHHMNYAARCIGIVSDSAIYLTRDAQEKLPASERIEDKLDWPIVVGGAKGLGDSIKIQQLKLDGHTESKNTPASVAAYKTKALVYVPCNSTVEASEKLNVARVLMENQYRAQDTNNKEFVPHLFLSFYTEKLETQMEVRADASNDSDKNAANPNSMTKDGSVQIKLILRVECLDSEHLERLLLAPAAKKIFNAGVNGDPAGAVNTETRFIRTAESSAPQPWKWASRSTSLSDLFNYIEVQPGNVEDIELYARRLIYDRSLQIDGDQLKPQIIEIGRLWGTPSIYGVIGWVQRYSIESRRDSLHKRMLTPVDNETLHGSGATVRIWEGGGGTVMPLKWRWES